MIRVTITGIPGQDAFVFDGLDSVVLGASNAMDDSGSITVVMGARQNVARALVPLLAELRSDNRFGATDFDTLLAVARSKEHDILSSTERVCDETLAVDPFKRRA